MIWAIRNPGPAEKNKPCVHCLKIYLIPRAFLHLSLQYSLLFACLLVYFSTTPLICIMSYMRWPSFLHHKVPKTILCLNHITARKKGSKCVNPESFETMI